MLIAGVSSLQPAHSVTEAREKGASIISIRRFCSRPSGVVFGATGRYSANPVGEGLSGGIFTFSRKYRAMTVALAVESSQFVENVAASAGAIET